MFLGCCTSTVYSWSSFITVCSSAGRLRSRFCAIAQTLQWPNKSGVNSQDIRTNARNKNKSCQTWWEKGGIQMALHNTYPFCHLGKFQHGRHFSPMFSSFRAFCHSMYVYSDNAPLSMAKTSGEILHENAVAD